MGNSNLERLLGASFPDKHMGRTVRGLYMKGSFHTLQSIVKQEIKACASSIESDEFKDKPTSVQKCLDRLDNLELLNVEISYLLNSRPEEEDFQD